jgi:hypothetical protein
VISPLSSKLPRPMMVDDNSGIVPRATVHIHIARVFVENSGVRRQPLRRWRSAEKRVSGPATGVVCRWMAAAGLVGWA